MAVDVLLVIAGLAILAKGADTFVLGAARLAVTWGLSPVVVGAVVIGFGTGAPEMLVSSSAAARGSLDIALGNVVGSNLANLTLVLGVAGLIARPQAVPRVIRREAPLSLATVVLFAVLLQNGLSRGEAAVLLAALVVAVVLMVRTTDPEPTGAAPTGEVDTPTEELVEEIADFVAEEGEDDLDEVVAAPTYRDVLRTVLGLVATVAGAQLLVAGAQDIAAEAGLSGGFVGLTLVAVGTSLPELVTAVQSARRNETALLAGNVLGSNVFNSTAVAGVAGMIGPGAVTDAGLTVVAGIAMVAVALLAWLFLGLGGRLRRWEAVTLLAVYAACLPLTA